jgi:death-on-curing protein
MSGKPVWVRLEAIRMIHHRQIREHGGMPGLRDAGLLEAAVARPQQLFASKKPLPTIPELAAACASGLVRNPPFVDGNKRTALVACRLFLDLNGGAMKLTHVEKYHCIQQLAAGDITEWQFAMLISDE